MGRTGGRSVDYKTFVKAVRNLPTPSPVLMKIESVLKEPNSNISQIADVIKLDPAITSKVLRLANSAYIGVSHKVTSLQNAIVLLGDKRVHSLVLASELLNSIAGKASDIFNIDKYWLHSVSAALVAEEIAGYLRRSNNLDKDEVFIAALLHDIGKLVLSQLMPDAIQEAYTKSINRNIPYWNAECQELDHSKAGCYLAEHWSFPSMLSECICKHHVPQSSKEHSMVVSVVHIADVIAHVIGRPVMDNEIAPEIDKFALEKVAFSSEQFKVIAARALGDRKKVDSLLEMFSVSAAMQTI